MKKLLLICLLVTPFIQGIAQEQKTDLTYRRSSLLTLMVGESNGTNSSDLKELTTDSEISTGKSRKYEATIQETFNAAEIPDKFNDHIVSDQRIITRIGKQADLSNKERKAVQLEVINKHLTTNNIAKSMIAKWFNRTENGGFDMNLISERGQYNATDLDVKLAKSNERGLAMLADAGEELIKNTFVVVNDFTYVSKEEVAKKVGKGLSLVSSVASYVPGGGAVSTVAKGAKAATNVAGKGYVIKTTSHLYKLVWDEETAAIFYNDYWTDDSNLDAEKVKAFNESDIFKLEYIGDEVAWADVQSSIYTKKSDEDLVKSSTVKAVDAVIAKLQRKYEVFRTKTPLLSGDPLSAKIGLKEGLEKGDKFEVLEQIINKEGKTDYKRIGVIKVEKGQIWDNRFKAADEVEVAETEGEEKPLEYTTFKGSKKKFFSGMLIRQID